MFPKNSDTTYLQHDLGDVPRSVHFQQFLKNKLSI